MVGVCCLYGDANSFANRHINNKPIALRLAFCPLKAPPRSGEARQSAAEAKPRQQLILTLFLISIAPRGSAKRSGSQVSSMTHLNTLFDFHSATRLGEAQRKPSLVNSSSILLFLFLYYSRKPLLTPNFYAIYTLCQR